jgi:hypothetical protein
MTRQEFAAIVAYIAAGCGKTLTEAAMMVYYDLLGDLPAEVLQTAAKRALLQQEYHVFPQAGTLRKLALEIMQPDRLSALEAWDLLRGAIRSFGYMRERQGLDSLPEPVRQVAERFGWQTLCDSTEPEICRAQFTRAYEAQQAREQSFALLPEPVQRSVLSIGQRVRPDQMLDYQEGEE